MKESDYSDLVINEEFLRLKALERIALIFNRPVESLRMDEVFGEQLLVSVVPNQWIPKDTEIDFIIDDINDVSDKNLIKQVAQGVVKIETVEDYCNFMIRQYKNQPDDVVQVLNIFPKESKRYGLVAFLGKIVRLLRGKE